MFLGEALKFSAQALRANPVRSLLTGLGMVIGTASVILVVTISLTSRDYILEQVQGIGSNIIFAYYVSAGPSTATADADYIKMADVEAIRRELGGDIVAATGVMSNFDRILIGGKEQDVKVIGTDEEYQPVRNIVISSGRFLDQADVGLRNKVALLTDKLAERMYGSRARGAESGHPALRPPIHRNRHFPRERWRPSASPRWSATRSWCRLRCCATSPRWSASTRLYVQVRSPQEVDRVAARVQEILAGAAPSRRAATASTP